MPSCLAAWEKDGYDGELKHGDVVFDLFCTWILLCSSMRLLVEHRINSRIDRTVDNSR